MSAVRTALNELKEYFGIGDTIAGCCDSVIVTD
jgi:hypothetical protein